MKDAEFAALLAACAEIAETFPEGVVFIDGIAVYLHTTNLPATRDLAESTHDADFYISLADMGDLRDIEELTPNRRLSKHQMIKRGFEFDIYTERQSALIVPYETIVAASKVFGVVRVASLEHLLVLKLEAFADRKGSAKGDKDAKDILRIASVAVRSGATFRAALVVPYLRDEHWELLTTVERGPQPMALARGNAMAAKKLRGDLGSVLGAIEKASGGGLPRPGRRAKRR